MKILVKLPGKNKKWGVSFGKGMRYRNRPETIYSWIERKIVSKGYPLASRKEVKTCVGVRNNREVLNESWPSYNVSEQLYALACFMEDWLPPAMLARKYKQYGLV